ncbi:hypothetical protein [Bacillus sp. 196mf]|uniref:hypothetical protein n=1 Tax=Bacillus sp. 196mf TaxID=1761754 RepID=UPI000D9BB6C4|nr:hypothetical protein [Bacillus sp. 196mf]PYE88087.1 hypothetical protein ATL10_10545 [Bacillus sp. 196mf]
MANVIKRRHTYQYAQIHNKPLQSDLKDLRAIGLLSHLMSLPNDWVIYKTQLHKKFSRKNIDAAWKELANKSYIIGFNCYVNGKKQSFYNVSDIPFNESEYIQFVEETINELLESGVSIKSFSLMKDVNFIITNCLENILEKYDLNSPVTEDKLFISCQESSNIQGRYSNEIQKNEIGQMNNEFKNSDELQFIIEELRVATQDELSINSFNLVLRKVLDKYKQGKIKNSFRDYFVTALNTKMEELEFQRVKKEAKESLFYKNKQKNDKEYKGNIMFYNWLEQ